MSRLILRGVRRREMEEERQAVEKIWLKRRVKSKETPTQKQSRGLSTEGEANRCVSVKNRIAQEVKKTIRRSADDWGFRAE